MMFILEEWCDLKVRESTFFARFYEISYMHKFKDILSAVCGNVTCFSSWVIWHETFRKWSKSYCFAKRRKFEDSLLKNICKPIPNCKTMWKYENTTLNHPGNVYVSCVTTSQLKHAIAKFMITSPHYWWSEPILEWFDSVVVSKYR